VKNQASKSAYFMVYQNDPGSWDPNALSIAWFAKFSNPSPTSKIKFTWGVDWGFSWADTGTLEAGIQFEASETFQPTGNTDNKITLDYNGAYFFCSESAGADPARFYMAESKAIPTKSTASVGVTMGGNTVYAVQASPNQNLTFSPHPTYYLAYGTYEEGSVIDVSTINNPLRLDYPTGVYALTTTLNADNTWTKPVSLAEANSQTLRLLTA
jgi:hypothetical protein